MTAISAIDAERFHREGWAGPFTLYAPDRAGIVRQWCDEVIDGDTDLVPGRGAGGERRFHNGHLRDRRLLELALDPRLAELVCALIGDDALLWRTHFWNKLPGGLAVPWHQDYAYWPLEPAVIVSAWIAIDRSTVENACLRIIPGSHRAILPHVTSTDGSAFATQADPRLVPVDRARPIELEAGQYILFNERMLHHSSTNGSGRRRLGLALRFIAGLTRVLDYDSEDHVLHPLRRRPALPFHRLATGC
jgi:ectoine hydroxylase-related dioxygenase (phytanoyl-CoA dioxygenase family)